MSEKPLDRRDFIKRAGIAGAVVATTSGLVVLTSPAQARGENVQGSGVVVGRSKKTEVLYRKTPAWELFYKSAL